ncbi:DUF4437 domain-containing protein [Oceanicoccus sagamiensis]|uniref:DUF4437 domain-containing protein n=1 Tax=Oceanicoccus sagamiensis TaxID=716816 RepID=A0A1X9N5E7_9GAMM|nr:DUF4437 domain-containing protein [Oceanicoccus sagamiensis]ARN72956.1 hypothetical protein BST96_01840 [Oceanicoccus sagamiensis]
MRPHVEFVDEKDLLWHIAELPHGVGEAKQKHLSYDEEDGSASTRVDFVTDWSRPSGLHTAVTEWFVLKGEVTLGDKTLVDGDYWCAPKGVCTPAISVKAGTEILLFREYGDWSFTPATADLEDKEEIAELTIMSSNNMEWYAVEDPVNGSPMNFERGGGAMPVPGMFIKLLYRNPVTGFYTRLIKAGPGWKEHPLAHHPVFEEAYLLSGEFNYNYGTIHAGGYFFRPAGVRHGDFVAGDEEGFTFILRCDGDLVDWYTDNARVEMQGDPVNWGEGFPLSEPPVMLQPVRSKTAGPWKDPNYQ